MSKKAYMIIGAAAVLIVGMLYYFIKDEPIIPKENKQEAQQSSANTLSYSGSTIVEEKDGKRQWELTADKIEVDSSTQNAALTNIKGTFYREDGGKIDMTAAQGFVDGKTHDVVLEGDIKAVTNEGDTFAAPKARWINGERHIYGSGGVKMTRQNTVMTGDELDSDANFEKVKISGNAHISKGGAAK